MSDNDKKPSRVNTLDILHIAISDRPFFLAMVIILPFVIFTFFAIGLNDIDGFKDVSAVWGAWVGSVIGYFFGSRQIESLNEKMDILQRDVRRTYESYDSQLQHDRDIIDDLEDDYEKAVDDLELLLSKYKNNINKELLERLKREYDVDIV